MGKARLSEPWKAPEFKSVSALRQATQADGRFVPFTQERDAVGRLRGTAVSPAQPATQNSTSMAQKNQLPAVFAPSRGFQSKKTPGIARQKSLPTTGLALHRPPPPTPPMPRPPSPPGRQSGGVVLRPRPRASIFQQLVSRYEWKDRDPIDLDGYYGRYAKRSTYVPDYGRQKVSRVEQRVNVTPPSDRSLRRDLAAGPSLGLASASQPLKFEKIVEQRRSL